MTARALPRLGHEESERFDSDRFDSGRSDSGRFYSDRFDSGRFGRFAHRMPRGVLLRNAPWLPLLP